MPFVHSLASYNVDDAAGGEVNWLVLERKRRNEHRENGNGASSDVGGTEEVEVSH